MLPHAIAVAANGHEVAMVHERSMIAAAMTTSPM
jgi:hypothetical protein